MVDKAFPVKRPAGDFDQGGEQESSASRGLDAPAFAREVKQLSTREMIMPDDAMRPIVVTGVSQSSSDDSLVNPGEAEPEVMGVKEGKGPGVRGPQDEPAAGSKHAMELGQGRSTVFGGDMLEHLNARQTVEPGVGKGQGRGTCLVEFRVGHSALGLFQGGVIDFDPRKLNGRKELPAVVQERPDVATDVKQRPRIDRHPADRVHPVPALKRPFRGGLGLQETGFGRIP